MTPIDEATYGQIYAKIEELKMICVRKDFDRAAAVLGKAKEIVIRKSLRYQ